MNLVLFSTVLATLLCTALEQVSLSANGGEDREALPENYPYEIEWIPGTDVGLIPIKARRTTRGRADMYYFSTGKVSHSRAAIYCLMTGRHLLSIKNDLIQEEVERLMIDRNFKGNIWLSGLCYKEQWSWGDLRPIDGTFNKLPRGRTKCNASKNLVIFGPTAKIELRFTWRPASGASDNYFICQNN